MKTTITILLLSLIIACNDKQENVQPRPGIYKNGTISTGNISNSGVSAPAGYTWSEAQNNTGNSSVANNINGIACAYNHVFENYKLTDDFIVPAGQTWDLSAISVYAFRSNYAGNTSPIDTLKLMIWDGHPKLSSSRLVFGDSLSNVLATSVDSLCYAILNSAVPAPGVNPLPNTKIWKLTANVSKKLNAGTYWLVWQTHDVLNHPNYSPPVKAKGYRSLPGWNAAVYNALKIWQDVLDLGKPAIGGNFVAQDMPFEIEYKY